MAARHESRRAASHHPDEFVGVPDAAAGIRALAEAVVHLAGESQS